MLSEPHTSWLSPHKYYDLYMRAFDELRKLEMFFREETRCSSCSPVDLYKLVQHASNILRSCQDCDLNETYFVGNVDEAFK
ncbi:hypothetical protein ABZP36_004345 [Zizania latifolia]